MVQQIYTRFDILLIHSVTISNYLGKFYTLLRFVTWRAFSFWNFTAFVTDGLLFTAFLLRLIGLEESGDQAAQMRLRSFQVLSFVAPLIW